MTKQKKILLGLSLILIIVTIVASLTNCNESSDLLIAFAAIVGAPVTTYGNDTNAPELNREDISHSVTQMLPSRTPLDTIVRNLKRSQRATSQKIGYYQASYKPVYDSLDVSYDSGSGQTLSSPTSSVLIRDLDIYYTAVYIAVMNPDMWRVHDTLLMRDVLLPGTKGNSIGNLAYDDYTDDVMFYVTEKHDNILKIIPINGMLGIPGEATEGVYLVPDFNYDKQLIRMGQAKSELDITTDPFAIYPKLNWQYCQNFMAQIEESTFQKLTQQEAQWGFSNFEAVNILSMKMEMELSMLFGSEGEHISGNNRTYFTRGITRDIENHLTYGTGNGDTTITKENYNTWLKEVFDGNNGSTNRVLFAGSGLIKSLSLVDEFTRNITSVEKDATLGVDVRKIQTYFGTLDVVLAPLFRESGWENNGLILDLEHVTKHEFVPLSVTNLDLKRSGTRNADARVIQEVSCLTLRHPDCHAIIKPKA